MRTAFPRGCCRIRRPRARWAASPIGPTKGYQGRPTDTAALAAAPRAADGNPATPPSGSAFLPPPNDTAACHALALKLVRAMIAAASAGGQIDGEELKSVRAAMEQADLNPANKATVPAPARARAASGLSV